MTTESLIRNWWMIAIRGLLAIAFGVTVRVWPDVTLSALVVMFGVYAIGDGAWSIAAGVFASERVIDAWPIWLEGVVSVGLGVLALVHPLFPRGILWELAAWGVGTGALELIIAADVPRSRPAHIMLVTAAVSSVFLAVLIVMLPYAGRPIVLHAVTAYAEVFGIVLVLAAADFARQHGGLVARRLPR
jgi:uncharacterized membrane protein HdeD (DUF308 family)